jgi:hypothetical protein
MNTLSKQIFSAAIILKGHQHSEAVLSSLWLATDIEKRIGERSYQKTTIRLFNQQEADTIQRLKEKASLILRGSGPDLEKADFELALSIFDLQRWYEVTLDRFGPLVTQSLIQGYNTGIEKIGINSRFPGETPNLVEVATETLEKVKGINDTVVKELATRFPAAIEDGADLEALTGVVQQVFDVSRRRAKTIAQTTATPVFEAGQEFAFEDAEIGEKVWLSRRDGKVRTGTFDHLEPDGQVQKVGDPFDVSNEELRFPGDPSGSPGNIINCRCTQLPKL